MVPNIEGIIVPVLTPFTFDTDEVDFSALKILLDRVIGTGVAAIIANAGTSEFYHLDEKERYLEAEFVVEQVGKRLPVLIGAGSIATKDAIRWAKHAESIGADGLLIMPPYYEPASKPAIVKHFVAISDAVSIPIMLYNNSFVSQVLLKPDDILELTSNANIPWVKLTTANVEHIPILLDLLGDRVLIFEGMDTLAFPSMAIGAVGCVLGAANAIPELLVELWSLLCKEKNLSAAQELNQRVFPLLDFLCNGGVYCSGLKQICALRGYPLGTVRSPWMELDANQREKLRKFAVDLDLIQ